MDSGSLEQLALELIRTASVSQTPGEVALARKIYGLLAQEEYFQQHPQYLRLTPLPEDRLGRGNVLALVRGEAETTAKTVILHGHLDTVGVEDYGELAPYADDPTALKEHFQGQTLPAAVKAELLSPDWLCGRGSLDMKSGLAVHLGFFLEWARTAAERHGNLVFLATVDEESENSGIIAALPHLIAWREQFRLAYVAALNNDYTAPLYAGDPNYYVYTGTVGKLLPAFYIRGRETHVGQPFEGFDPALLAAEIVRALDLNPELADESAGEVALPPTVLKLTDLKQAYTVQTPGDAFLYCNYLVHGEAVEETLAKLKRVATEACRRTLAAVAERAQAYATRAGLPPTEPPGPVKVWTYAELYAAVERRTGPALRERLAALARQGLAAGRDHRLVALDLVREVARQLPKRQPQVVLFFAPPYCPPNHLTGSTAAETHAAAALEAALAAVRAETGVSIERRTFFPGISDSSYLTLPVSDASLAALQTNFPGWGELFTLPVTTIRSLSIPALNLGAYGKDGHKFTERVYKPYTFGILPQLVARTVEELLRRC